MSAILDDDLSPSEEGLVRKHLASCKNCEAYLEELKKGQALLNTLDRVEPPPWLTQKIMARINERTERQDRTLLSRLFRPLTVMVPLQAVALVLVVGLTVLLYRANFPEYRDLRPSGSAKNGQPALSRDVTGPGDSKAGGTYEAAQPTMGQRQQTTSPPHQGKAAAAPLRDEPERSDKAFSEKEKTEQSTPSTNTREAPDQTRASATGRTEVLKETEPNGPGRSQDMKDGKPTVAQAPAVRKGAVGSTGFKVLISAEDVEVTTRRIEDLLDKARARTLTRTSHHGATVITFEVENNRAEGVITGLKEGFGAEVSGRLETGGLPVIIAVEIAAR